MAKPFYEFFCPVKILAGHAALEHIPFELTALNVKKVMFMTYKSIHKNQMLDVFKTIFHQGNIEIACLFDEIPADSSLETVTQAAHLYRTHQCDAIVCIGGGSVIDTAKATNILVSEGGDDLQVYAGVQSLKRPLKPLFVVPTTSGTGSEVTMVSVISDTQRGLKIPFASQYLMPNVAILDPRMTQTLPPYLTALTAMDALTHAIEAYTCLAANPLSDAYATAAIQKMSENIFLSLENPKDAKTRLALAEASTMAGIAFSNSMVGLVHALGHALGAVTHLPHGLCMSLFLPYVLEYNLSHRPERIASLLLPLAGAEIFSQTPQEHRAEQTINTIFALRDRLYEKTQLPRTLKETGKVSKDQFEEIADKALNDGSIIYNPKETTFDDLYAILEKCW